VRSTGSISTTVSLLALALAGAPACTEGRAAPRISSGVVVHELERAPTLLAPPAPAHPFTRPGPAYLHAGLGQLVAIDEGAWVLVDDDFRGDLLPGADGHVYVLERASLSRLEGTRSVPVVELDTDTRLLGAAVAGSGAVALLTGDCCAEHRLLLTNMHGRWQAIESDLVGRRFAPFGQFDDRDRLWGWTRDPIERLEWSWPTPSPERVDVTLPIDRARMQLAAAPGGAVYAFADEVAYRLSPDEARIPLPGLAAPSRVAISPHGTLALAWNNTCAVARVFVDGRQPVVEHIDADLRCHFEDHDVIIDGRDRIWVPNAAGAWVLPVAIEPIQFELGTVPLLPSGAFRIAVVGAGPDLLPPPGPIRRATLVGRIDITRLGRSSAGVGLTLRGPFDTVAVHASTDADGRFEFVGIPIGQYSLAVADHRHEWHLGHPTAKGMREGEVHDLGLLSIPDFDWFPTGAPMLGTPAKNH
jgi:hypothetical protein